MYNIYYYVIFWIISFALILPIIIFGVIYSSIANKSKKINVRTINDVFSDIKKIKSRAQLQSLLSEFKNKHKIITDAKTDIWFESVKHFVYCTHWETDAIASFSTELENANPSSSKRIANTVSGALKVRDKNKS